MDPKTTNNTADTMNTLLTKLQMLQILTDTADGAVSSAKNWGSDLVWWKYMLVAAIEKGGPSDVLDMRLMHASTLRAFIRRGWAAKCELAYRPGGYGHRHTSTLAGRAALAA